MCDGTMQQGLIGEQDMREIPGAQLRQCGSGGGEFLQFLSRGRRLYEDVGLFCPMLTASLIFSSRGVQPHGRPMQSSCTPRTASHCRNIPFFFGGSGTFSGPLSTLEAYLLTGTGYSAFPAPRRRAQSRTTAILLRAGRL